MAITEWDDAHRLRPLAFKPLFINYITVIPMKFSKALVLSLSLFAVQSAMSADASKGFYAGVSAGQGTYKSDDHEDKPMAYKLTGGYQFNNAFALETSLVDFGQMKFERQNGFVQYTQKQSTKALTVQAVGILPVNDVFSLKAKAGLVAFNGRLDQNIKTPFGSYSTTEKKHSDGSLLIGLGAAYAMTKHISLVGEYEAYPHAIGYADGKYPVKHEMWSLGAVYRF